MNFRYNAVNGKSCIGAAGIFTFVLILTVILAPCRLAAQTERDTSILKPTASTLFIDAVTAYNIPDMERAWPLFYKVIEKDPSNDAAYYYLANIAFAKNELTSGEFLLKKAISMDSTNYWYQNLMGRFLLATNRTESAISHYENLIKQFPKRRESYYSLVNLYMEKQDVDKSTEILDKIERVAGVSEASVMTRFNIFRMMQNYDGALKYLVSADDQVQSPRVQTMIGDLYAGRYQDSIAMQYYDKALKTASDYPLAIFGKAELLKKKGEYEAFFENIIPFMANPEINSQTKQEYIMELLNSPGFVNKYKNQVDSVISVSVEAHQKDTNMVYMGAAYYAQTGNFTKGAEILYTNLEHYPKDYPALTRLLSMLYTAEKWEELEQTCRKYEANFPDKTDIPNLIGISLFQMKRYDEAIKQYELLNAMALKQRDTLAVVDTYLMLGDLSHETGLLKESTAYYKKALKIDGNNAHALNNFAYYMALDGKNLKKAYQMSVRANELVSDNGSFIDTQAWILYLMGDYQQAKNVIKKALLYGGNESPDILDHYAEILYALKEYDLAFIYWDQAKSKDIENTLDIAAKIARKRAEAGR